MLDLSWGDFGELDSPAIQTKKCRFCKLVKSSSEFGRWPDCEDGLHYFCSDCWDGFCRQGKPYGENMLTCLKCNNQEPVSAFYREHVFGSYAPWCNLCRSNFIAAHTTPKIPTPPKPPRLYRCQKCHEKKPDSDFGLTANGKRDYKCSLCRSEKPKARITKKAPKQIKCLAKTQPLRDERIYRAENHGTQICCVCVIEKHLSEFPSNLRKPLGVCGTCRQCRREKKRIKTNEELFLLACYSASQARAAGVHDNVVLIFPPKPPAQQTNEKLFRCRKFQANKPLTEFAKASRKCGHDLYCKECSKIRKWNHRQKQTWEQKIISGCKSRASKKKIPFDMKPEDLYDNSGALPIYCPIFPDIRLDYTHGLDRRYWASVDRIVPELGYTSDNIRVVSMSANTWKSNGSNPKERARIIEIMTPKNNHKPARAAETQNLLFLI